MIKNIGIEPRFEAQYLPKNNLLKKIKTPRSQFIDLGAGKIRRKTVQISSLAVVNQFHLREAYSDRIQKVFKLGTDIITL
ncbi:MAG: hypothetical protein HWQ35_01060 [Nostoc sp. NMS1]|uniref:hypothetical protein n=1 Tax=unclassified Nostoc TaxID=2593658 RepID=UPI0025CD9A98|nr:MULTISPECIES: hypothetical protein [unclassified Nostoc]MBN3905213.1 hypothetical protein [Nostoc sp. NMS1]MBN3991756.1 hypothetical protein [Nostoc sp. NMS2]